MVEEVLKIDVRKRRSLMLYNIWIICLAYCGFQLGRCIYYAITIYTDKLKFRKSINNMIKFYQKQRVSYTI
jgi:hypothetical protein